MEYGLGLPPTRAVRPPVVSCGAFRRMIALELEAAADACRRERRKYSLRCYHTSTTSACHSSELSVMAISTTIFNVLIF